MLAAYASAAPLLQYLQGVEIVNHPVGKDETSELLRSQLLSLQMVSG